jgi:hypothetical protein
MSNPITAPFGYYARITRKGTKKEPVWSVTMLDFPDVTASNASKQLALRGISKTMNDYLAILCVRDEPFPTPTENPEGHDDLAYIDLRLGIRAAYVARTIRKQCGLTQEGMIERLKVADPYEYTRLENPARTNATLAALLPLAESTGKQIDFNQADHPKGKYRV